MKNNINKTKSKFFLKKKKEKKMEYPPCKSEGCISIRGT
jgi:hypothetical protein